MCRRKEAHLSRMMRFTLLSTSYGPTLVTQVTECIYSIRWIKTNVRNYSTCDLVVVTAVTNLELHSNVIILGELVNPQSACGVFD